MKHIGTLLIKTERLILRHLTEQDSEEIYDGFRNQKEFLYYTNKKAISLQEQKESLVGIEEKYKNKDYYNWLIILKDTNQMIGAINLNVNL
ncbi:MAG: GNAT family N-acetyltransferase [Christensenellales bacterium]